MLMVDLGGEADWAAFASAALSLCKSTTRVNSVKNQTTN